MELRRTEEIVEELAAKFECENAFVELEADWLTEASGSRETSEMAWRYLGNACRLGIVVLEYLFGKWTKSRKDKPIV
jgi:hypothetical protein